SSPPFFELHRLSRENVSLTASQKSRFRKQNSAYLEQLGENAQRLPIRFGLTFRYKMQSCATTPDAVLIFGLGNSSMIISHLIGTPISRIARGRI
ncbi:MAG: hypothetical protein ABJL73_04050, partial [Lentilitoribacter sp.]